MDNVTELFTEHSRKIATGVSVFLVVLMSLSVAHTVLVILENMNPPGVIPAGKSTMTDSLREPGFKVSSMELFGRAQESTEVRQAIRAPETKLNLELQGVFITDSESRSTAIIGEKNKNGELYSIGDKLPGNATLASVFEDYVLIRRGTRMEKLLFSDSRFRAVAGTEGQTDDRLQRRISPIPGSEEGSGAASRLSEYRDRLRNNPQGTLNEIGITAVSDGEARGYRVGSDARSAIRQAGLQPGDVILSVNGRPVGMVTRDSALIEQVMASSRVRVEVRRGSRRFFLTVPVPK